jgi:hypothetical protein
MWIQDIPSEEENDDEIIDITSALQLLVVNSYEIGFFPLMKFIYDQAFEPAWRAIQILL